MRCSRFTASFAFFAVLAAVSCRSSAPLPEREGMEDPEARARWFWEQRAYPAGTIPVGVHRRALLAESRTMRLHGVGDEWTNLGPAPLPDLVYNLASSQDVSGRGSTLAMHPSDPDTMLLGTAEGGIWKSTDRGGSWRSVGEQSLPTLVVSVIRYSAAAPNVVFAGTGEARGAGPLRGFGLARSRDGGETWELLPAEGDGWDFNFTAITGLHVVDSQDGRALYLTTATIAPRTLYWTLPADLPQTGVFRSTDDGESWQLLRAAKHFSLNGSMNNGFTDFEYGGAAAPDLMYIAEYHGGILRSTDRGATWSYVTPQKATGYGTFPATPSPITYTAGLNRFALGPRLPNPDSETDFRIIELAAAPSDPHVLYASFDAPSIRVDVDGNGVFETSRDRRVFTALLFKSSDAGETWRWLGTRHDGVPDYCGFQCWYDNVISVHPADPDDVIVGGSANYSRYTGEPFASPARLLELPWRGMLYQSRDGGTSWTDITPHCTQLSAVSTRVQGGVPVFPCTSVSASRVIHPDIHGVVRGADGIYAVTDGGVFRGTLQSGTPGGKRRAVAPQRLPAALAGGIYSWSALNHGLSTMQFYRIAAHPTDPDILLGGLQDNSAAYWDGEAWHGWGADDGTIAIFHPLDPRYVYLGTQYTVHRHDGGGTKEFSTAAGWSIGVFAGEEFDFENNELTSFIPVFAVDPANTSITYGASDRALYRSTERGARSVRIGPESNTVGVPTSISVSPVDPRVVWLATDTGAVYRYDISAAGTATATRLNAGLPNRSVSRIVAGFDSAGTVYVVFNGYDANTPSTPGKVFVSRDRGLTWQNASGDLPDVPANAIALDPADPNRIWLATDAAVYVTRDGGATWQSERRNMPVVTVMDVVYNANTRDLVAATFGRGIWKLAQ